MWSELVYISDKGIFCRKVCLWLHSQKNLYFIVMCYLWVFDGGEFYVWDFSEDLHQLFNSMELHTFKTTKEEKNEPLINPIHHFSSFWSNLIYSITSILSLFRYYFSNFFASFWYYIYMDQIASAPFCCFNFSTIHGNVYISL